MSILAATTNHRQVALVVWTPDPERLRIRIRTGKNHHLPVHVALIRFDLAFMPRAIDTLQHNGLRGGDAFEVLEARRANFQFHGPRSGFNKALTAMQARLNDVLDGPATVVHGLSLLPREARFETLFPGQAVAA